MEIYGPAKDFTGDSFLTASTAPILASRDLGTSVRSLLAPLPTPPSPRNERFELANPFFSPTHLIDWTPLYHCSFLDLWPSLTPPVLGIAPHRPPTDPVTSVYFPVKISSPYDSIINRPIWRDERFIFRKGFSLSIEFSYRLKKKRKKYLRYLPIIRLIR